MKQTNIATVSSSQMKSWKKMSAGLPKGPLFMMSAAFLFALLSIVIKVLDPSFRVWDIAFYRFGCGMAVLIIVFGRRENLFKSSTTGLLIIRGITGSIAFVSIVVSIRLIPLSTSVALFYTFPAFSALFAPFLFKEKITAGEVLCIAVAICGVGVMMDFHLADSIFGQLAAVVGAAFAGLTVTLIRHLRKENGPVVIYLYFCLLGFIITFPFFLMDPKIPGTMMDWGAVAAIVLTSITAQLLMNQGLHYCRSWEGGVLMSSELVITTLYGVVFLSEPSTWCFWIGCMLIMASALGFSILPRYGKRYPSPAYAGEGKKRDC